MKQFLVNCDASQSDSSYVVNAESSEEAARIYIEASFNGLLAEHVEDMEPHGTLLARTLPPLHTEGLKSWEGLREARFDLDALIEDYHAAAEPEPAPTL